MDSRVEPENRMAAEPAPAQDRPASPPPQRLRPAVLAGTGVIVLLALAALYRSDALRWLGPAAPPRFVTVSGNVEAHESVLAFKTVQSRIVVLPFDEGASVKEGTVIARVDDADYRQQVAIANSVIEVEKRQFEAAEQNWDAMRSTLLSDDADRAQKKNDADRAEKLWNEKSPCPIPSA